MYPKDRVHAYEGKFQLEEVMAKPYYERGNRLRMENKTKSSKVLIDNEVAHTAAAAHITIRNSAKKSHSLRNVEEFRVAEDNADNCPPPPRSSSQNTTVPNGNRFVPPLRNVRNLSIYHDAETPPRCRSPEKTKTNTDRDVTSPRNTFHIHQDDESIPPTNVSSPDCTLPNRDGRILPNSNTFQIHQDDENIPPASSRDTTIPSKGIPPPNNVLRNNDIHCEAENIPPLYGRDMTLPNRGGSNPPLGNFRNTHTHDAENIPPSRFNYMQTSPGSL